MVFSLQVLVAAAVVWNCSIFLTRGSGEGDAHLHDPKFREWLEEHKELLAEQKLDLGEVYPNWLENARFVKEHNSLGLQYKVVLNAFAHKVFEVGWGGTPITSSFYLSQAVKTMHCAL